MAACTPVVHCKAAFAHSFESFDKYQFFVPHVSPVSKAKRDGDGDIISETNLAFEDIGRMKITKHSAPRKRLDEVPLWTRDNETCALVITTLWEGRAFGGQVRKHVQYGAPLPERLAAAQQHLVGTIPSKTAKLDRMCRDFVQSDPAKRKRLASDIAGLDTQIRVIQTGPGIVARIITLYWKMGCNSVAVGEQTHFGSTFVRQILHRCKKTHEALQNSKAPSSESERTNAHTAVDPYAKRRRDCAGRKVKPQDTANDTYYGKLARYYNDVLGLVPPTESEARFLADGSVGQWGLYPKFSKASKPPRWRRKF